MKLTFAELPNVFLWQLLLWLVVDEPQTLQSDKYEFLPKGREIRTSQDKLILVECNFLACGWSGLTEHLQQVSFILHVQCPV